MKRERIYKQIKVLKGITTVADIKKIQSKKFRSYGAVAKMMKPGEKVLVEVDERMGSISVFAGYGEIERVEDGWIEPKRLMSDY